MKKILTLTALLCLAACNLPAPGLPRTLVNTPAAMPAPPLEKTPSPEVVRASPTPVENLPPQGAPLSPVSIPRPASLFNAGPVTDWQPANYAGQDFSLPLDLAQAANPAIMAGLTGEQMDFMTRNGFVVIQSQEAQFGDIRQVGRLYGHPYFLTTDAAFHALHLTFDELLKAIEKQNLRPRMAALIRSVLGETLGYLDEARGTALEEDARLAAAYLSAALRLFDPQAGVDERLTEPVEAQLAQIEAGGGQEDSVLVPGFKDDYGAYRPVGHYAGDPALEAYFRGMTWLGRVHFRLEDPNNPNFKPSRAPLLITLALRRASLDAPAAPAIDEWADMHALLTFLVGPSDDAGPAEYSVLMDGVYGNRITPLLLGEPALWEQFLARSAEIPAPQINSTFAGSYKQMGAEVGWRFLGQRFTLDGAILQNLVYDHVGTQAKPRQLPSGLDVLAAFGSQPALEALEAAGETAYDRYLEQMGTLQNLVQAQNEEQWLETVFGSWLYAFLPQVAAKDAGYPAYMRTRSWGYKELNSALGSWAELKHDTVLYAKMPEGFGGGGPPSSGPAPAYVEPNPPVFYRMAALARMLSDGLLPYIGAASLEPPASGDFTASMDGLPGYLERIRGFAGILQALGDIADRELAGEALTPEDYSMLQDCLGPVECQVEFMDRMNILSGGQGERMEMPPVPVIAVVAGAEDKILEVGVGRVDRLYVVVPLEGRMEIAQGGVFSYFEFPQTRSDRLTDDAWRARLDSGQAQRPAWAVAFSLPGGNPTNAIFFRIGDVYLITQEGDRLNLRQSPGTNAPVLKQLSAGEYITIIDGPEQAGGKTWWKIRVEDNSDTPTEGWVVEDQAWYERAWGQ